MKKKILALMTALIIAVTLLPVSSFAADSGSASANTEAASSAAKTIVPTDKTTAGAGCVLLGIEGSYIVDTQNALDRINAIRLEACREGVKNPSTGRKLTEADYVPIRWSSGLEYIARIRAAESSLTMNHVRTNGSSCFNISSPEGVRSWGEVLAWSYSKSVIYGINQWYKEKADWVNQTGGVTGHYTQMIDPSNRYVGLGTFYTKSAGYPNTTAGEFSSFSGLDETKGTGASDCIQLLEVPESKISGYSISGENSGYAGDQFNLRLMAAVQYGRVKGSLVVTDGVEWKSSNPACASVGTDGTVTLISCGAADITAEYGGKTTVVSVTAQHETETDAAVAATCTSAGKTEGSHCEICGAVIKEQMVVPQLSHKWKGGTYIQKANWTERVMTCQLCKETKTTRLSAKAQKQVPAKNAVYQSGNLVYVVKKSAKKNGTVYVRKAVNSSVTSLNIPASVKIQGYTFLVTGIENKAFSGFSKLTKVTVGKNVTYIGAKAFYQDKKLKNIILQSKNLSKIGAQAFAGIAGDAVIHVPKQKTAAAKYQKLLKNSRLQAGVKIKSDVK